MMCCVAFVFRIASYSVALFCVVVCRCGVVLGCVVLCCVVLIGLCCDALCCFGLRNVSAFPDVL